MAVLKITGAGATFPYPLYSKWFSIYQKQHTDIEFNYQAIGSGGGIRQLLQQTVDFGASDAPMNDAEMKQAPWPIIHIPTVLGAVALVYNVEGFDNELKLSPSLVAEIFMGKVTKWNDPAIKKLNMDITAKLPDKDILVVHRADGSGTTAIFTDFLATTNKAWESTVGKGKAVKWPTGIGAKGNDGVTDMVKQTPGTIGYVELAYAKNNNLKMAAIQNKDGVFLEPSIEGISAAASSIKDFYGDLRVSLVNGPGKMTYPISSFTYILIPNKKNDDKIKALNKFLIWAISDGQKEAASLHYAPLPKELSKVLINKLKQ